MPYKNKEDQLACFRRWYARNKKRVQSDIYFRRKNIREWFREYKAGLKCSRCDEDDPACLDFHHTEPNTKKEIICQMVVTGYGIETILTEIAKCVVLCANCHRKLHRDEYNHRPLV